MGDTPSPYTNPVLSAPPFSAQAYRSMNMPLITQPRPSVKALYYEKYRDTLVHVTC